MNVMLRRFSAGFVAALFQLIAVVLATLLVPIVMRPEVIALLSTNFGFSAAAVSVRGQLSILTGTYLILSFGVALTENRFLESTATHIRYISHLKRVSSPTLVMTFILFQFSTAAAAFAILALQKPPQALFDLGYYIGWNTFPTIWSGTLSIGSAYCGANAYAALRALLW